VVCAAIRHRENGRIICGPRHFDATMHGQINEDREWRFSDQGFVDQFGAFLTREEAWVIANQRGQIRHTFSCSPKTLYSEHLY
jgi:hypothetical protein